VDTIITDHTQNLSYFACGEYGTHNTHRPHYHAVLFNCDFKDKQRIGGTDELPRYTSETLHKLWGLGITDLGNFTPAAGTYIAKYALKGAGWTKGDGYIDENGEWFDRPPPFARMSRRPAIGLRWLKENKTDLTDGFLVTLNGRKTKIPRTYLRNLKKTEPQLAENIDHRKYKQSLKPTDKNEPERLAAAEIIHRQHHERAERLRKI